ncbi:MAG: hypothetical protein K1X83_05710 [Oligoflexia bacterium]|nr:hypothetical protein [Oligoflexia bacterium]
MAIDFSKLFQRGATPIMTARERQSATILVVETDSSTRNRLRQTLTSLDFGQVVDAPNHTTALTRIEERPFSHIIFEARRTSMQVKEFLTKALQIDSRIIAIPTSYEPTVDEVFDLLIMGARGYLVKPFTTHSVDEAIIWSTKGDPISDSILFAKTRNEALAALVMNSLGRLSTIMKQSQTFETARRELPKRQAALKRAMEIARMFAQGGEDALLASLIDFAAARAEEPATRLGKVRRRLDNTRHASQALKKSDIEALETSDPPDVNQS